MHDKQNTKFFSHKHNTKNVYCGFCFQDELHSVNQYFPGSSAHFNQFMLLDNQSADIYKSMKDSNN